MSSAQAKPAAKKLSAFINFANKVCRGRQNSKNCRWNSEIFFRFPGKEGFTNGRSVLKYSRKRARVTRLPKNKYFQDEASGRARDRGPAAEEARACGESPQGRNFQAKGPDADCTLKSCKRTHA